jgi:hypothetical protein
MVVGVWIDQCRSDEPLLARCENGEGGGGIATIRRMRHGGGMTKLVVERRAIASRMQGRIEG